ncbi:MAG: hypothetical protein MUO91_00990 [candidate division Zixibacteria bacterium]|nr:hypothetical protein [candidate division Zixibacteria bacterium]
MTTTDCFAPLRLSLTLQERFQLMFKKSRELIELLERNGHRRPDQIIKRT